MAESNQQISLTDLSVEQLAQVGRGLSLRIAVAIIARVGAKSARGVLS